MAKGSGGHLVLTCVRDLTTQSFDVQSNVKREGEEEGEEREKR